MSGGERGLTNAQNAASARSAYGREVVIQRVANGWVVSPYYGAETRYPTPMYDIRVARTPQQLGELIAEYAKGTAS